MLNLGFVAHRFNVVPIGPNYQCSVVVWVVVRAKSGSTIVLATSFEGSAVEIFDLLASVGHECEVKMRGLLG